MPHNRPVFSPSGVPIAPVYRPADAPLDYARDLGEPGQYPYTRGVQPDMYRGRLWTMRQYAGFGTAHETNARFRLLLEKGQTGLSVAFDLPTQMGIDSDSARALGEVGRVGVAIGIDNFQKSIHVRLRHWRNHRGVKMGVWAAMHRV